MVPSKHQKRGGDERSSIPRGWKEALGKGTRAANQEEADKQKKKKRRKKERENVSRLLPCCAKGVTNEIKDAESGLVMSGKQTRQGGENPSSARVSLPIAGLS